MKFTEGYWLRSENVAPSYATQGFKVEKIANGMRVLAPERPILSRADALDLAVLQLDFVSAGHNDIAVTVTHYKGYDTKEPRYVLNYSPDPVSVDISEEEYAFCKNNNIKILKKDLNNFAQTAAVIENMDIVVSTDNVILNLAGAMGKKTLGLFNWYYEYRWYDLTGEDVGWYTSVKPFINPSINDWQSSVTRVVEEIQKIQKTQK